MKLHIEDQLRHHSACTSHLEDMPFGDSTCPMAYIELTRACNLSCGFCRRKAAQPHHKSFRDIERDMMTIKALSQSDTVVLSGGEPLLHPELEAIVKMVASANIKPILLTNGVLITRERLTSLKSAGLFGIMYQINAMQHRPGWEGCNEVELNTLRLELAELAGEFDLHCSFNTLVFPSTLNDVQRVALWASAVSNRVHMMTFIATRRFEARIPREEPEAGEEGEGRSSIFLSPYSIETDRDEYPRILSSHDIYDQIQKVFPGYRFNSFLGSTAQSGVLKWAMGTHLCRTGTHLGNLGPTAVGLIESICRKITRRSISHFSPRVATQGWLILIAGLFDKETRKTIWKHWVSAIRKPLELFRTLHLQTFVVMQSLDILPEGEGRDCNGYSQKTTLINRLNQGHPKERYMLGTGSKNDSFPEDNTQMQWPKQSSSPWRDSELELIGREGPQDNKLKN